MTEHGANKICSRCRATKYLYEFSRNASASDGRRSECKECQRESDRRRWAEAGPRVRKAHYRSQKKHYATKHGKKMLAAKRKRYEKRHKQHIRARWILARAIKRGEVVVTGKCQSCGRTKNVECHHADHTKPLEFIELCKVPCHRDADLALLGKLESVSAGGEE